MTASAGDGGTGSATDAVDESTDGVDGTADDTEDSTGERSYGGIFGAYPYALRQSESRLFRGYAVVGGLAAGLVVVLFVLAVVVAIANTTAGGGGTFTFSRAFFVFLMMLVIAPLVAPVLAVARRHRHRNEDATGGADTASGSSVGHDRAFGAAGFLFLLSLYAGLGISVPPALQEDSPGAIAAALYSLPRMAGFVPPLAGAVVIYLVYRHYH